MRKTFNQLTPQDPVCIQITTKKPLTSQSERAMVKTYFQEFLCDNKVEMTDCAFETISFFIDSKNTSELHEKQNIYICFNKWIREHGDDSREQVSFTSFMNEMSDCFAHGNVIQGDSFLPPIENIDMSDWIISYFDSIESTKELL